MNFKEIVKKNKIPVLKSRIDFPILIRQMGYKKICEVGVHQGQFLSILSMSGPIHLVGVDIWNEYDQEDYGHDPGSYRCLIVDSKNKEWKEKVQSWAKKLSFKVDIIVNFSVEAAKQFKDDYFDFVYIDADHTYKGVTADLEAWYPKVRKGGMLAGHDYCNWTIINGNVVLNCKDGINDFVKKYGKEKDLMLTREENWKSFFFVK